jgi:hypothetical protein
MIDYYIMDRFLKRVGSTSTAAVAAAGLVLVGCAGVIEHPDGHVIALNSNEFRAYVESTFRYQNKIADALAFALVDGEPADSLQSLEIAEQELMLACSGVNELAAAERDGVELGALVKLGLARQVADCQTAADSAERVLAQP